VSILMASPLAKGLFQCAIGESGGPFEPLQLAPKYLLANAEQTGEKYAASLGAPALQELRRARLRLEPCDDGWRLDRHGGVR
jgi:para-nitrobenzyl esterase